MPKEPIELEDGLRYFLVSWDNLGVEYLEDITKYHPAQWAKQHLFGSIKKSEAMPNNPLSAQVTAMTLRARYNSQRFYEIYVFTATDSLAFEDVKQWGEDDPQGFADFVRKNHAMKILDQRARPDTYKII